jgi:hypothetical protein
MRTETSKIKIVEQKRNVVVIGNSLDLVDIIEIFLYKNYNVIVTIDEFDGMKKIEHFKPVCIFIKAADNINPALALMTKLARADIRLRKIPVIAFSKDKNSVINDLELKSAGIREIIKFPISQKDFAAVIHPIINAKIF